MAAKKKKKVVAKKRPAAKTAKRTNRPVVKAAVALPRGAISVEALTDMPTDELVVHARKYGTRNALEALCIRLTVLEGKLDKLHALGVIDSSNNVIERKAPETAVAPDAGVEGDTFEEITQSFTDAMCRVEASPQEFLLAMSAAKDAIDNVVDGVEGDIARSERAAEAEPADAGDEIEDEKEDEEADAVEG